MCLRVESILRRIIPFCRQSCSTFNCAPAGVGDNSDTARQFNNRTNASNGTGRIFLHPLHFRAVPRRPFEGCVQHAGNFDVDAVTRLAGNDVVAVDAWCALPNNFEILLIFQRRVLGYRQLRGISDQFSVVQTPPARRVNDRAARSGATIAIDFPACRRSGSEHLARGRSRLPQRLPTAANAIAHAGAEVGTGPR